MRRRMLTKSKESKQYNALRWISGGATDEATSGTCWIDTGFLFGPGMIIELDMEFTNTPFYCNLLGTETFYFESPNEVSVFVVVNGKRSVLFRSDDINTRYQIGYNASAGKAYYFKDGALIYEYSVQLLTTSSLLYLFRKEGDTRNSNYHFYGLTVTDSEGGLLLDLHPALDLAGIPCVFDTVSEQYYYNSGTDTLRYETLEGKIVNG